MTYEEYQIRHQQIIDSAASKIRDIKKLFASSNRRYNVGDKITDGNISIIITDFCINDLGGYLNCFYDGVLLTKNGNPRKDKSILSIAFDKARKHKK